jgi:glycerophosphoryl diester phosphodiesterase
MRRRVLVFAVACLSVARLTADLHDACAADATTELRGRIIDADSGQLLPARFYIQSDKGDWYFPKSAAPDGSAVEYRKQRPSGSSEMHTTLSAHPFSVKLPPGRYDITAERGKEYLTFEKTVDVANQPVELTIPLKRWINLAERGWYSGDTHTHRAIDELPNIILAEDLNVALPLTYWVTKSDIAPIQGDRATGDDVKPELISVDKSHVIYPLNTEYEIFSVKQKPGQPHTLGAVFVLGHKQPFDLGVPPVAPVAAEARRQGALLDLDKHSWPWSLMIVPVMNVDLFELSNNHVWRTQFGFPRWTIDMLPPDMQVETNAEGFTEWGWIDFGFKTYYSLLDCGFRMRPSGGTASGVHPVPLGFGRVYVQLPDGFSYDKWMQGLDAGRSFVSTGPMLFVEVNGQPPGSTLKVSGKSASCRVTGSTESPNPIDRIEIVSNGSIVTSVDGHSIQTDGGGYRQAIDEQVTLKTSGWIVVRVFEKRPDGRVRFAHSSPVHVEIPGRPLRPRREEVRWIVDQIQREIARNDGVLEEASVAEYRQALRTYQRIERFGSQPTEWGSVRQIVAHRGASLERPECTLASTLRAIEAGATAVEVDVRTTKDGHLVLLHDATLDRTTNGSGKVSDVTFEELRKLDAGSHFDTKYADQKVPTLAEVAEVCKGKIDVLLDLKESGSEYAQKLVRVIRESGDPARTIVGVRSVVQAREFRRLLPEAQQIGLIGSPDDIEAYAAAGVETIRLWPRWLTDESLVPRVRKAGARLHLNGSTGTPEEATPLLKHHPDSMSSDDPARLTTTLPQLY